MNKFLIYFTFWTHSVSNKETKETLSIILELKINTQKFEKSTFLGAMELAHSVLKGFGFYRDDEGQRNKYLGWQTEHDTKSRLLSGLCEDVDIHLIARFAA